MTKDQPWKGKGVNKNEWLKKEVEKAVGAGKPWNCETVDFSDPHRPPTCIEVDFPIIPINQIAAIEGNAGKPIYQMSKWWARRRSSVFRSMLLASVIKAPDDPSEAAKVVWDAYYGNHQKKGTFKNLKVADIFMGGGTTVVEGSRLGMQMFGNDLNPIAWFVVKNELAQVDKKEVEALLADIEAEVKPQIMPYYTCDCPRGHKGVWTHINTGEVMGDHFDPLVLTPSERKDFSYRGPEMIYSFWVKHGPCQITGCGHRTPIMNSPVMAIKTLTVKSWARICNNCGDDYDLEERNARMAPDVSLVVSETERPFAVATLNKYDGTPESAECPCCGKSETFGKLDKGKRKKVELTLLVHPEWLQGEASRDERGRPYGGSVDDSVEETVRWNQVRAEKCRLIEVRGLLPEEITCPYTGTLINVNSGTKPKEGAFSCGSCGATNNYLESVKHLGKNGPVSEFAVQCYCPQCKESKDPYGGRFFKPNNNASQINASCLDWQVCSQGELSEYFPSEAIPYGERTHVKDPLPKHGFHFWWQLFNQRQLGTLSRMLKALDIAAEHYNKNTVLFVAGAIQQFIRNQNMLCFWHRTKDHFAPALSNNNYNPKDISIEVGTFCPIGYGPWNSVKKSLIDTLEWKINPWELVHTSQVEDKDSHLSGLIQTKSTKVFPGDSVLSEGGLTCGSSTELEFQDQSIDLVITDPPFGGLLQYSELADFLYAWLRRSKALQKESLFSALETPKALECVSNTVRHEDPEQFYQRLLTECWRECGRVIKPNGILAFTFHHSDDRPWISVLESLFDAGFFLVATYPIRGDETKGDSAQFGSQKIEYDIIHVCRKRSDEPKPISWAKLRRQVLHDVRDLQELLEHHQEEGLPEADVQVIRRGKALEYFSRHYGKVYKDQDTPMSVLEALLGINQLLDEEAGGIKEAPPHNAEPFTRMLMRLFDGICELPRDQMQKFLRGSGSAPSDFVSRGWVNEKQKVFHLTSSKDLAQAWIGRHRKGMQSDYDQAMFLIGACFEGSGINASETLNNENFNPHPALGAILTWFKTHGADSPVRNAAITASKLYQTWEFRNQAKVQQLSLFDTLGEEEAT